MTEAEKLCERLRTKECHNDLADDAAAMIEAQAAEIAALRIGWWNDMNAWAVSQDVAIAKINAAVERGRER